MSEITDFGPRKTIFILAIVAGCFAVLWPKIFYPMLTASVTPHHTSDSSACCDVIFESDVTAADILLEICQNILKHHRVDPRVRDVLKVIKLTPQSATLCRDEILARCGIDLSTFLAERERLGKSYKQVLEEIRSFNSSLCLKMHFGIPLSQLGTPHLIRYHILMPHSTIRQERRTPPHAGGLHPALRERGRAIPSSHIVPKVAERPDHVVPKMRPPLGGAGHVVPAPKGNGTMGIIMPLYTLGIVLFFLYTIVKVLKKNSDSEIISEYSGAAAEKEFRKMVFSPEAFATAMTGGTMHYQKERSASPHRPAPTIEELSDLVDGPPKSKGLARVDRSSKNDTAVQDEYNKTDEEIENVESSPIVKVMGMEMTASCESKGSRPTTPIIPASYSHTEREKTPPKPIYLEGALPAQCELLVTDSETQAQKTEEDAEAPVVLSGKMTLSLISLDQNAAASEEENKEMQKVEYVTVLNARNVQGMQNTNIFDDKEHGEIQIEGQTKKYDENERKEAEIRKMKRRETVDDENVREEKNYEYRNKMENHEGKVEEREVEKRETEQMKSQFEYVKDYKEDEEELEEDQNENEDEDEEEGKSEGESESEGEVECADEDKVEDEDEDEEENENEDEDEDEDEDQDQAEGESENEDDEDQDHGDDDGDDDDDDEDEDEDEDEYKGKKKNSNDGEEATEEDNKVYSIVLIT